MTDHAALGVQQHPIQPSWYFFYNLAVAAIGPLLFGYHLAELNAPQEVITCQRKSFNPTAYLSPLPQCIPMTAFEFALISSMFTVGGFIGALASGPTTSKYGRLRTMRFATLFFTLGPVAEACAPSVGIFALGRFISGLGASTAGVVVPLYIAEISPPARKGFYGSFTQISTNLGIVITQLLGLFLSHGHMWRVIMGIGGAIGLNQLAALFFSIDSPKWTADNRGARLAKRDLQKIRAGPVNVAQEAAGWDTQGSTAERGLAEEEGLLGDSGPPSPFESEEQAYARASIKPETVGMVQVLSHPKYSRGVYAVIGVMVAQQFSGVNSIIMYGTSLLSDLLTTSSTLLNVGVGLLNLIVTFSGAPLVDRFGRKPCLLGSIAGMAASSFILAIAIPTGAAILSAIAVLAFIASFALGLGPVPFILASELVGAEAVGATQSWALGANWFATFLVAQFFPPLNEALGHGRVYFVFAALGAGFFMFVLWRVPETKDRKDADEVWDNFMVPLERERQDESSLARNHTD